MSGHSKFANIKHKKEKNDAAKGKIFTVIGREIAVAVKEGGADPANNSKLRDVIAKAKSNNMPNDTINRGIKKAAGISPAAGSPGPQAQPPGCLDAVRLPLRFPGSPGQRPGILSLPFLHKPSATRPCRGPYPALPPSAVRKLRCIHFPRREDS